MTLPIVDHLFLLVGENPLPNAVAAMALLRPGGQVYLVHTAFSVRQAQRLQRFITAETMAQAVVLVNLGQDQADAASIYSAILSCGKGLVGAVGMNYTGGTKAMAVHAYRILAELYPKGVFSYLDSNTMEMVFDQVATRSLRFRVKPCLSLTQLIQLHGLEWREEALPLRSPIRPDAATFLAQVYTDRELSKCWRQWCQKELRRHGHNRFSRWQDEWTLSRLPPLSILGLPVVLQQFLQEAFGASETALELKVGLSRGFSRIADFCGWLDGVWLEHYTLAQIQQLVKSYPIHESGLSLHIAHTPGMKADWDRFEFDVAFVVYYQLFALSCSTAQGRALCKQKLIEAHTRARQLGGAEARVGLVCVRDDTASLRSELEEAKRLRNVGVFGRQDLGDLAQKIGEWVGYSC
jgi:hypothetical protein